MFLVKILTLAPRAVMEHNLYEIKCDVLCCRAAEKGNFEAAVKLGIAYLYNEGRKSTGRGGLSVLGIGVLE